MQPTAILETVLYVADVEVATRFYADVLGLEPISGTVGASVFFRCGSGVLILFNVEALKQRPDSDPIPKHGAIGQGHTCFRASRDEIALWKAHLEANNIAIESEVDWPNGAHSLYFRDPSGNSIEFAEPQLWNLK